MTERGILKPGDVVTWQELKSWGDHYEWETESGTIVKLSGEILALIESPFERRDWKDINQLTLHIEHAWEMAKEPRDTFEYCPVCGATRDLSVPA